MNTMKTLIMLGLIVCGCCSEPKIQVIHNDKTVTNTIQKASFQDESYVWESWLFSTNRVDR